MNMHFVLFCVIHLDNGSILLCDRNMQHSSNFQWQPLRKRSTNFPNSVLQNCLKWTLFIHMIAAIYRNKGCFGYPNCGDFIRNGTNSL